MPTVFVPEWPTDKMLYRKTLLGLRCFDVPSVSQEDLKRAEMYATERQRQALKPKIGSLDEWLRTLGVEVKIEELNEANLPRAAQLLNKTNQMNLRTRRMTEGELASWAAQDGQTVWTFRVSDRFGDSGLTGILSIEIGDNTAWVADFVLSCRVMGRKVEETMLFKAVQQARVSQCEGLHLEYLPTTKNKPCLRFLQNAGLEPKREDLFCWSLTQHYEKPDPVTVLE
jgi:FkbH-like protein